MSMSAFERPRGLETGPPTDFMKRGLGGAAMLVERVVGAIERAGQHVALPPEERARVQQVMTRQEPSALDDHFIGGERVNIPPAQPPHFPLGY